MKIYRWYSEALNMSGITVANEGISKEDLIPEIECYIDNTFNGTQIAPQLVDDLLIYVWPIEEDNDYNELCSTTIAISY